MLTPRESVCAALLKRVGLSSPCENLHMAPRVQRPFWKSPHMLSPPSPPARMCFVKFSQAAYFSGSLSRSGIGMAFAMTLTSCDCGKITPISDVSQVLPAFHVFSPVTVLW